MIKITRGLDIPLPGKPNTKIEEVKSSGHVGLVGPDYVGMKPSMKVKPGDHVQKGQIVFSCKRNEGLHFTAPASGKVVSVNRGAKRAFQTLVIEPDSTDEQVKFASSPGSGSGALKADSIRESLVESGLWASIRERPFDKIAPVNGELPQDIFVSIADSNPAAPCPGAIITREKERFQKGLAVLEHLCNRHLYVCSVKGQRIHIPDVLPDLKKLKYQQFKGPHPAGNVGTHMHFLSPPTLKSKVWYVGYQDVIAIGALFTDGSLWTSRYVGISGPLASNPRILKTRLGVDINSIIDGEFTGDRKDVRVISGSVLHGHTVTDPLVFLGKYHNQITLLREDTERELLGWHMPGATRFSSKRVFAASFLPSPAYDFSTSSHGSSRALVPFGHFEKVCAFDTLPTQLLRALLPKDTDTAQELGVLELGEEDMALFTFVSTGKTDFGPILRENLDLIEKEG